MPTTTPSVFDDRKLKKEGDVASTKKLHYTRIDAVDALRGLAMAVMIFNSYNYWGDENLRHIAWWGMNLADYELPVFVFVLGFSKAEAVRQHYNKTFHERLKIVPDMAWRMFILFLLGLLYNGTPNWNIKTLRIPSVLMRLGCVDFLLSLILLFIPRLHVEENNNNNSSNGRSGVGQAGPFRDVVILLPQWSAILCLLTCYFAIVFFLPVPFCTSSKNHTNYGYIGPGGITDEGIYARCTGGSTYMIDRAVFGENHLQHYPPCQNARDIMCVVPFDDLGIVGILSTTLSAFIGVQASEIYHVYMREGGPERYSSVLGRWIGWALLLFGITMICTGGHDPTSADQSHALLPVIKSLWTPSFATFNASFDLILLCILFACIDVPCGTRTLNSDPHLVEEARLVGEDGEPSDEIEGYSPSIEVEGPPLFNGTMANVFAPFRAMGKNSIGAYLGSRFCYTWIPLAFPSFFGLADFTRNQLLVSSVCVTAVFLLVCWLLERDGIFFDFFTRRPPWRRRNKKTLE